jgi:7,8-dihydropterin-6-yl-methyl-4-(beta-D-ribofuranosyl)aminobenzene 5'-phosphate synthase
MRNEPADKPVSVLGNPNITVVYDNSPYREGIRAAWGFSCLLRGWGENILFDTGRHGSILIANMLKLSISPDEVDIVVLSHYHKDHVGGLINFLDENSEVVVYLPKSFPADFKAGVKKRGASVVEVDEPMEISEGVHSTGEAGGWSREQSLISNTERGLVVTTGCSHPGIVEIIARARDLVRKEVLLAVGGFHMSSKSRKQKEKIISDFREMDVANVGPCHCTGQAAKQLFEKEYVDNFIDVGVGKVIDISRLS